MAYLTLTPETLPGSHICCALSDKKCAGGSEAKKQWLGEQYAYGYRFRRLDERAKVFIEYGPAESAWMPVIAPGWLVMGCFWVSGRHKGHGHGKALLGCALQDARDQGRAGLVAVVGRRKMPFQSDGEWLLRQGFREVDALDSGFCLLALALNESGSAEVPRFAECARNLSAFECPGITAYYSDRCPFTKHHVEVSLRQVCHDRGLHLTIHKLDTVSAAQNAPSPATIFSLFVDGRFATSDLSACTGNRFDKVIAEALGS
ncbi:YoaP domain-containing protein [Consotaella salsifontis]|uniref:YoaP-like n=1 Tax=Consotaella salsifontis TaxID=1365950 RepID=A0A1T4SMM1_9HYPH|nr:YoaP domain-containing protein [Consotaella salsifontis]SKA29544.1 YoaP-like [Consotaella salsifontis]